MSTDQITEPILHPGDDDKILDVIYQALGVASVAWDDEGVFLSEFVKQVGEELLEIFVSQAHYAHAVARSNEVEELLDELESAWGLIANASDWHLSPEDERGRWVPYAEQWRERYRALLAEYAPREQEEPLVAAAQGTMVIETTRKGKYVRSYGPFTPSEAGEFALAKIELQNLNGGRHEFILDSPTEEPWANLSDEPEPQQRMTLDEFLGVLDEIVENFDDDFGPAPEQPEETQRSTADLDMFDKRLGRKLTTDDVRMTPLGEHRKPWTGRD